MTREEFIEKWKHEFLGFLLDAIIEDRRSGMLVTWLKLTGAKIHNDLGLMWADLQKELERGTPQKAPGADKVRVPQPGGAPPAPGANRNAA